MTWNGEVPPLGFEGERLMPNNRVLHIPSPHGLGPIEIYAWTANGSGEGYNIFFNGNKGPVSVKTPLEVQFIVHEFLNKGEDNAHKL